MMCSKDHQVIAFRDDSLSNKYTRGQVTVSIAIFRHQISERSLLFHPRNSTKTSMFVNSGYGNPDLNLYR